MTSCLSIFPYFCVNLDKKQKQTHSLDRNPLRPAESHGLNSLVCPCLTQYHKGTFTFCHGLGWGSSPASASQVLELIPLTTSGDPNNHQAAMGLPGQGKALRVSAETQQRPFLQGEPKPSRQHCTSSTQWVTPLPERQAPRGDLSHHSMSPLTYWDRERWRSLLQTEIWELQCPSSVAWCKF